MTTREALHHLVDHLDPDKLPAAERLLESLQRSDGPDAATAERTARPPEFGHHPTIEALAAEQGVQPVTTIDSLRADFWPEDEDPDAFVAAVRRWRRDDPDRGAA